MDEVISLSVRNRKQQYLQVAGQIETPRPPDPILRLRCADREEKRVTHGRETGGSPHCNALRIESHSHAHRT
jgi:hypothetical protein